MILNDEIDAALSAAPSFKSQPELESTDDLDGEDWTDEPEPEQEPTEEPEPVTIPEPADIIDILNKKHAFIMLNGKALVLNFVSNPVTCLPDVDFSAIPDFRNRYLNQETSVPDGNGKVERVCVAKVWLKSSRRREFQGVVFDPSGKADPSLYNFWQGFSVKPVMGQWKRMEKHIFQVICNGDTETFRYVMAWLARILQDPGGKRPGVALVLRGKQGTGKGIFAVNFGKIFGPHFKHITNHHLVSGRFNDHFKDALFVFADESFWTGDKQAEGTLKGMVTEDFNMIEAKGKNACMVKNHSNFIFASNNDWVVPAGEEERRFCVLDVSEVKIQDAGYFRELSDEMDSGGREAMLYDLLHLDISKIDLRKFPRSEALLDQIISSLPSSKRFWVEMLKEGTLYDGSEWVDTYMIEEFYDLYQQFCRDVGERFPVAKNIFSQDIHDICPGFITKQWGVQKGRKRYYRIPPLADCRKNYADKVNIEIKWKY